MMDMKEFLLRILVIGGGFGMIMVSAFADVTFTGAIAFFAFGALCVVAGAGAPSQERKDEHATK